MGLVDIILCNEWEAPILLGYDERDPRMPLRTLLHAKEAAILLAVKYPTLKTVVVSVGARHACFDRSAGVTSIDPLPNPKLVDVVGAADAFVGAYVHASCIAGKDGKAALEWAACASTIATTMEGAQKAMPNARQLQKYIEDNQQVRRT
jgi:sugar/nucleoside kinase (ribokinase family)